MQEGKQGRDAASRVWLRSTVSMCTAAGRRRAHLRASLEPDGLAELHAAVLLQHLGEDAAQGREWTGGEEQV